MKKYKKIILIVILVLLLIPLAINFYIINKTTNKIYDIEEVPKTYDLGLVLGCAVHKDKTPSKMLKDRLDSAIYLYQNKKVKQILVSGDHHESYSEVEVMQNYLAEKIPIKDILVDYKGYSTSESIENLQENYAHLTTLIISQKYHLPRAVYIAEKLNLEAAGAYGYEKKYHNWLYNEVREILARNKDFGKYFGK